MGSVPRGEAGVGASVVRPLLWMVVALLIGSCGPAAGTRTDASPQEPSTSAPVTAAPSTTSAPATTAADWKTAAEELCPVMWEHAKAIGRSFNDAAGDVVSIDAPDARRDRWRDALEEMRQLDEMLRDRLADISTPALTPILADVDEGIDRSLAQIASLETLIDETPEIDEERQQRRTAQLIVRIEKVIDAVKPEMSEYDDGVLIDAWRTVPSCQHGVKDVDDGTPQANG